MSVDVEVTRRRFTVAEYHRMGEAGIFPPKDRLELIRGEIIHMAPIGIRHSSCVARLNHLLVRRLGERAVLWPQNPLTMLPDSEPQPDIMLLRYRDDFYRDALPAPADVALLIEVAETSLRFDRVVKGALYAEAGVREYWIVDLEAERVEVHREPADGRFQHVERVARDGRVVPTAFPDFVIRVAEITG
jgi:Uma2 family endonuclease